MSFSNVMKNKDQFKSQTSQPRVYWSLEVVLVKLRLSFRQKLIKFCMLLTLANIAEAMIEPIPSNRGDF